MPSRDALDAAIRHAIDLQHYSNGQVIRILGILNRADSEIFTQLLELLERLPAGSATGDYLWELMSSIRRLNATAYESLGAELTKNLKELASVEAGFQYQLYASQQVPVAAITAEAAWAASYSRPFMGKMLREAIAELGDVRARRIRDRVRMGFLEGRTTSQIVRDIRGTKAKGYVEGFLEVDRRHIEAMVDTAVKHTAAGVRERFFEANADVLGQQVVVATLDSRTSEYCLVRSGKRYTIGDKPKPVGHNIPWCTEYGCAPGRWHWRCRSTAIALLPGQRELYGTRASASGPVDANLSYGAWLRTQPASVQDEALGATRGKLFRAGEFEIDRFANERGRWLTLDQLRERDASMFKRAGL